MKRIGLGCIIISLLSGLSCKKSTTSSSAESVAHESAKTLRISDVEGLPLPTFEKPEDVIMSSKELMTFTTENETWQSYTTTSPKLEKEVREGYLALKTALSSWDPNGDFNQAALQATQMCPFPYTTSASISGQAQFAKRAMQYSAIDEPTRRAIIQGFSSEERQTAKLRFGWLKKLLTASIIEQSFTDPQMSRMIVDHGLFVDYFFSSPPPLEEGMPITFMETTVVRFMRIPNRVGGTAGSYCPMNIYYNYLVKDIPSAAQGRQTVGSMLYRINQSDLSPTFHEASTLSSLNFSDIPYTYVNLNGLFPPDDVQPIPTSRLGPFVIRALGVLAMSDNREDPEFQKVVQYATEKGWPVSQVWVGCEPEAAKKMRPNQWIAALSFRSIAEATKFSQVNIKETDPVQYQRRPFFSMIEPCGG